MHKASREYTVASISIYNQLFGTVISALLLYMVKCNNRHLIRDIFFQYKGKPIRYYMNNEYTDKPSLFISIQPSWLKKLLTKTYGGKDVEDINSEIDHILDATNDEIISTYLGAGGPGSNRNVFGCFCERAIKKISQRKGDSNLTRMYNNIIDCYCSLQLIINNYNIILRDIKAPTYNISDQLQSDVHIEHVLNSILTKLKNSRISHHIDNLLFTNHIKLSGKIIRSCAKICKRLTTEIERYSPAAHDIVSDLTIIRINCSKSIELGDMTFGLVTNIVLNDSNRQLYYYWTLRYWLSKLMAEFGEDG